MLFRDPIANTRNQLARAIAFQPTVVIALDLLFWDVYGSSDRSWHREALAAALAELDTARTGGAWVLVGDVPLITTASEMLLPRSAVPDAATLEVANESIRSWAARERVLLVPLAEWTEPLRSGGSVKMPTGEMMEAAELMAIDGRWVPGTCSTVSTTI